METSKNGIAITAELDLSDIGKGTYPYYMLKEIDEQPTVMRKLIQAYTDESGQVVVDPAIIKAVQEADRIYILAAGTSYHAGFASKKMLEELTDTPVELGISSEWGYGMPLLSKKPLFIFISQSGETADSRQVLVKANEMGIPSLTVTNVPGSTLSREADMTMLLHAGPEIAVASTKAYTAQIAALAFLAKAVGEANGNEKAKPLIWCTNCLSLPNRSINPFRKRSDRRKSSWLVGNNPQCFLYRTWPRLLCCHGSQSEIKRNFLHPM